MSALDWVDRRAARAFVRAAEGARGGRLMIVSDTDCVTVGDELDTLAATLEVHRPRMFRRAMLGGMIGLGDSFMDGDWSSPDVVALLRLALRNMSADRKSTRLTSSHVE